MAFCQSTHSRVTGHITDLFYFLSDEESRMAYSGAGQGGFNPSMPSTHHNHIIFSRRLNRKFTHLYVLFYTNDGILEDWNIGIMGLKREKKILFLS
jgi:hypothetical protein